MYRTLPPIAHPDRPQAIRSAHARMVRIQGRTSFADTGLRLGIAEAEVLQAHQGRCIHRVADLHGMLDALILNHRRWIFQSGESHGFIQCDEVIQEASIDETELTIAGQGWMIEAYDISSCSLFAMRRCCKAKESHFVLCDSAGNPQLRLMPKGVTAQTILADVFDSPIQENAEWPVSDSPISPSPRLNDDSAVIERSLDAQWKNGNRFWIKRGQQIALCAVGYGIESTPTNRGRRWHLGNIHAHLTSDGVRIDAHTTQELLFTAADQCPWHVVSRNVENH